MILNREERAEWVSDGSSQLGIDRLVVRLTAKDAVRRLLASRGVKLCPADIHVVTDSQGKFHVQMGSETGVPERIVGSVEYSGDGILAEAWIASGKEESRPPWGGSLIHTAAGA